jgi:hypothetical protein
LEHYSNFFGALTILSEGGTRIDMGSKNNGNHVQYCHVLATDKQMIVCQYIQAQRIHKQLQTTNEPFTSHSKPYFRNWLPGGRNLVPTTFELSPQTTT